MQSYEIQLPERGYQRTPPYTGYIEIEPIQMPGYGERRKPFEREEPTTYRLPTGVHDTYRLPSKTNGLEMLLSYGDGLSPSFKPINPFLDGGLRIRFDKTTYNTTIVDEKLGNGEIKNIYINHDNGLGRIEEKSIGGKTFRNPYF